MCEEQKGFAYTYSAQVQEEIKQIRQRYAPQAPVEEDKMQQLRRLDAGVAQKGSARAFALGIISALVMGAGMSLIMTDLGAALGISERLSIGIGIAVGVAGLVGVAMAYPLYNHITQKERQRIAPEIIRLTDELMK